MTTWCLVSFVLSSVNPFSDMMFRDFLQDHVDPMSFLGLSSTSTSRSLTVSYPAVAAPTLDGSSASSSLAIVWKPFQHPFPCFPSSDRLMVTKPARQGILFQRPTKVASTTMVGIILRLAHHRTYEKTVGMTDQQQHDLVCEHRTMHGSAVSYEYGQRDASKSFLLSLVRDPTQRAISEFFHFAVAGSDVVPTDENFQAYLRMERMMNYYLNDLKMQEYTENYSEDELESMFYAKRGISEREYDRVLTEGTMEQAMLLEREWQDFSQFAPIVNHNRVVQDILSSYNFIGVTERMDESLLVLQTLLNLTTREILYTRARSSGSFSVGIQPHSCKFIFPSFVTPGMQEYFASKEWKRTIRGDQLLYDAVNASLDRTIDALGRTEFERKLKDFRVLLARAQAHCEVRLIPLCGPGGKRNDETSCYIWGEGCDHECLQDFVF